MKSRYVIRYHTNHNKSNESEISVYAHSLKKALMFAEKEIRAARRPSSIHFERYESYDNRGNKSAEGFCIKNV